MMIALLALQVAGFVALYVLLRRAVMGRMSARNMVRELRSEVAALIVELNGATERNVALLEDGIGRLQELLRSADRGAAAPGSAPDPGCRRCRRCRPRAAARTAGRLGRRAARAGVAPARPGHVQRRDCRSPRNQPGRSRVDRQSGRPRARRRLILIVALAPRKRCPRRRYRPGTGNGRRPICRYCRVNAGLRSPRVAGPARRAAQAAAPRQPRQPPGAP